MPSGWLDRWESEEVAVVVMDDGQVLEVARGALPAGAAEGAGLRCTPEGVWSLDGSGEAARRAAREGAQARARATDDGGDIAL